jgi:hypothetical protein
MLTRRNNDLVVSLVTSILLAGLAFACNDDDRAPSALLDPTESDTPRDAAAGGAFDPCVRGGAGCACTEPGQIVSCGTVTKKVQGYKICFKGYRKCDDGKWTECVHRDAGPDSGSDITLIAELDTTADTTSADGSEAALDASAH